MTQQIAPLGYTPLQDVVETEYEDNGNSTWSINQRVGNKLVVVQQLLWGNPFPQFELTDDIRLVNPATGSDILLALTVPVGYKALSFKSFNYNNAGGPTALTYSKINRGGTLYTVGITFSANNNALSFNPFAVYPGDVLYFAVDASLTGLWIKYNFLLVPDRSPFKIFSLPLVNGDNTIYTVPAGKTARIVRPDLLNTADPAGSSYCNTSGNSLAMKAYIVPAGASPSAANQVGQVTAGNNTNSSPTFAAYKMTAGESFVFNVNQSSGVWGTFLFYEADAE